MAVKRSTAFTWAQKAAREPNRTHIAPSKLLVYGKSVSNLNQPTSSREWVITCLDNPKLNWGRVKVLDPDLLTCRIISKSSPYLQYIQPASRSGKQLVKATAYREVAKPSQHSPEWLTRYYEPSLALKAPNSWLAWIIQQAEQGRSYEASFTWTGHNSEYNCFSQRESRMWLPINVVQQSFSLLRTCAWSLDKVCLLRILAHISVLNPT